MHIQERKEGNILVARVLDSRLDATVAHLFKDKMSEYMTNGANAIVLDISDVEFIDSSGLGAVVSSLKAFRPKGEMVISGTQDPVMTIFKLTRMDSVFRLFPSENEAIAALS